MSSLSETRLPTLGHILQSALEFGRDAGVDLACSSPEALVFESGHQPNFLSHAGLWKKIFLLDRFRKKARDRGKKAMALFGFSDYNLCTARLLTSNRLPAFNKHGFEKLGFKLAGKDVWRRFDCIEKPSRKEWEGMLEKISSHYERYPGSWCRVTEIVEILDDCYRRAKNFPDVNAFFIAKVSRELSLDVSFFRYSDLQRKGAFIEQWKYILSNLGQYNRTYNNSIEKHGLGIPQCAPGSLPFWYHCKCGAKVALLFDAGRAVGKCQLCASEHAIDLDEIEEAFKDMSPNAVARNIIFSEGLGTHTFISGTGGSRVYGRISDDISREFGLNLPVTVSWQSRDYYTGPVHAAALSELASLCEVRKEGILREDVNRAIGKRRDWIEGKASAARRSGDDINMIRYKDMSKNIANSISIIKSIFSTTPSFIDILISVGAENIKNCWDSIETGGGPTIVKDAAYDAESFSVYKKIEGIAQGNA